jgi:hypothetical protein
MLALMRPPLVVQSASCLGRVFGALAARRATTALVTIHAVCTSEQTPLIEARKISDHGRKQKPSVATVGRGVSERPVNVRQITAEGRSIRRMVSREHTLHDQVQNLRMELSDLKVQVGDLAAVFGRVSHRC